MYEPDRPDNLHRRNMGMFPAGAHIIPNPYNKIPGFFCQSERGDEHFSDGPPLGKIAPSGGRDPHAVGERGGEHFSDGPPLGKIAPSGGSDPHAVGERGGVFFVPGFPVMAWPMIEWVLDTHYRHFFQAAPWVEQSVIVFGAMEATLTPLMEEIERDYAGIKVFSLPSVDHPQYGRHIELGVKGEPEWVSAAYRALLAGLLRFNVQLGPQLVHK